MDSACVVCIAEVIIALLQEPNLNDTLRDLKSELLSIANIQVRHLHSHHYFELASFYMTRFLLPDLLFTTFCSSLRPSVVWQLKKWELNRPSVIIQVCFFHHHHVGLEWLSMTGSFSFVASSFINCSMLRVFLKQKSICAIIALVRKHAKICTLEKIYAYRFFL